MHVALLGKEIERRGVQGQESGKVTPTVHFFPWNKQVILTVDRMDQSVRLLVTASSTVQPPFL